MNLSKKLTLLLLSLICSQAEAISSEIWSQLFITSINGCSERIGETLYSMHIPISYRNADGTAMLTKHINLFELCMTAAGTTAGCVLLSLLINAIAAYRMCDNQDKKNELRYNITLMTGTLAAAIIATGTCLHHIIHDNPVTAADII